ncbi:MAG: MBOAT family protein [Lachnospiraceae bacterium]|nr:MBOAT family protein [Lachnospiraceae bacterium]MBQ9608713.1 MBOAT family protein [Lachnospiraceae bacterium]
MTFSSVVFLFMFLPVTFLLYALIRQKTIRNIILVIASLFFYAFGEPVAVIIMIISIIFNYIFGLIASGKKHDKLAVFWGVIVNIGLLIAYKYTGFFATIINDVTGLSIPVPHIRLPIGISFFTFQGLSYVIDVYRNKNLVQKNFFYVLLYISFFPQLIAGPIVRYEDIAKQIEEREFNIDRVSRGICRFIFGLGKKVLIANQMGFVADTVFGFAPSSLSVGSAWLGAVCYTFQIFFDFSGYSDMAIGLGCMFGFDFRENFNYPFIAPNIQNFWGRWHISLSSWFKEYVYIPMGGSEGSRAKTTFNKFFIFFLSGFWHGANFTFIVWGLIHGFCQMLETYQIIPTKKKWFKPFGHIYTMLVVILAFVIFRSDTLTQGFGMIKAMFTATSTDAAVNAKIMSCVSLLFVISLIFAIILSTPVFKVIKEKVSKTRYAVPGSYIAYIGSILIFVLAVLSLVTSGYNPFIYFRF